MTPIPLYRVERKSCPTDYYHPLQALFSSYKEAEAFAKKRGFRDYRIRRSQTEMYPMVWKEAHS